MKPVYTPNFSKIPFNNILLSSLFLRGLLTNIYYASLISPTRATSLTSDLFPTEAVYVFFTLIISGEDSSP
jgi:hypothetical protein